MPGRLGIDFGTSNTLVAVWNEANHEGVPLHIPEYGRQLSYRRGEQGGEKISIVPSLIHYAGERRWIGQQVLAQNLYDSPRTFRWMKRYIARRSPVMLDVEGRRVSHFDAGREFLSMVMTFAAAELDSKDEEVAFTAPVEAFEHYENWLIEVAESAKIPRFRLIDEASAAALGYGAFITPGDVYLIFDFGGGTLDLAVVLIEEDPGLEAHRRCRVLGKAGAEIGGASVDAWLYQEVLRQNGVSESDDAVRPLSRALLVECEKAKEQLSFQDRANISATDPIGDLTVTGSITRAQLEALFDEHEAYNQIDQTIRRALNASRERGYDEENIKSVLMVGGSSLIPSVRQLVQRVFGRDRVLLNRPLDAVARGAAAFVAGVDFFDHIQHDYAIRYVDPRRNDYDYRILLHKGTPYPTTEPLAHLTIKASHSGQSELGIAIFELGEHFKQRTAAPVELVFDPEGAARIRPVDPDEEGRRYYFWVNEHCPTFLHADPPAEKGEPRFEVEFHIDGNKRLLITARDLRTKKVIHRNHPVIRLT
jgi:molecular chaperone DnaK (HSP70)